MQQGICFHSEKLGRTALTDIFTAGLAGSIYRSAALAQCYCEAQIWVVVQVSRTQQVFNGFLP